MMGACASKRQTWLLSLAAAAAMALPGPGVVWTAEPEEAVSPLASPPALPAAPAPAADAAPTAMRLSLSHLLSDQLALGAVRFGVTTRDHATLTAVLLDLALELRDGDAELWRQRLAAADALQDKDAALAALNRYCRLQPEDDQAQYDLVVRTLDQAGLQKIEDRVARVVKVLDSPQAKGLTPALRSRLASLAAGGAREAGDHRTFARRLAQAMELDPSNLYAAQMFHEWVLARKGTPAQQAMALVALVRADPANPRWRGALMELLLSAGLYREAVEQVALLAASPGHQADPRQYFTWALCLAAAGDPAQAVALLDSVEAALARAYAATQPAAAGRPAVGGAPATQPAPGPSPLPVDLQVQRLAILRGMGRTEQATRLWAVLRQAILDCPPQTEGKSALLAELAWMADFFGDPREQVAALVKALETEKLTETTAYQRGAAMLAAREGRFDAAADALRKLTRDGDLLAAYLLSTVLRQAGRLDEANAECEQVVHQRPDSLAAMAAVLDLAAAGKSPAATDAGRGVLAQLERLPAPLRTLTPGRDRLLRVEITAPLRSVGYLEPMVASVTVQNISTLPLSLGAGGAIPTPMAVLLSARLPGADASRQRPVAVDLSRRLRLEAGESVTLPVRVDRSELGARLANLPALATSISAQAVVDPRQDAQQRVVAGPMGDSATLYSLRRESVGKLLEAVADWQARLTDGDEATRAVAAAVLLRGLAILDLSRSEHRALGQKVAQDLAERLPGFDSRLQAWCMCFAPTELDLLRARVDLDILVRDSAEVASIVRSLESMRRTAAGNPDPLAQVFLLGWQTLRPDSAALASALRHSDPRIRRFAEAARAVLSLRTPPPELPAATQPAGGGAGPASTAPARN